MARLIDVKDVVMLNSKKEKIGAASGANIIRVLLVDFAKKGEGNILVFSSPAGEKVSLAMSHGGDLQIELP